MKKEVIILVCSIAFLVLAFQEKRPTFKFSDKEFVVGAIMVRRNIIFKDPCQTTLKSGQKTLDSLATLMNKFQDMKIAIEVHDGTTLKAPCMPSANAAKLLLDYLVKKGIGKERLTSKGYGTTMPVDLYEGADPKKKKVSEKINKRIVFKISYFKY